MRFALVAFLLFCNGIILEANEVVATTGFISSIGVSQIVIVWAIDMTIIIITSGIYSLFVDRAKRSQLAIILYLAFAAAYFILYFVFTQTQISTFGYAILLVLNDQQWLLFPLIVWALANDMFSTSEAKRLFPVLGIAAFTGGMVGNALSAVIAQLAGVSYGLFLFNTLLILFSAGVMMVTFRRITFNTRQSRAGEKLFDALKEGLGFVREVPMYRHLTLTMILLGIGLNMIEFDFLRRVSESILTGAELQTFYGSFKLAVALGLLIVQSFVATWVLNRVGFKGIFNILPIVMFSALALAVFSPVLLTIVLANYVVRVTKQGIDDPSNKAFQGLVPDERRGRVSAFMDGYLYPLGSLIGCFVVGATLLAVSRGVFTTGTASAIYLSIAALCALVALWSASRIRIVYDTSMLNWRLKRRKRASSLADIEF
jgi:ATP/ADP translocase